MPRIYKKRLEDAVFKLLELAQELGVSVRFTDPDICDETTFELYGQFDCTKNQITCYKDVRKPLSIQHVHTLAHELRHAWQFRNKMVPIHWLALIGIYPKYKNSQQDKILEDDADQWANEFMIKNKLPVPTVFPSEKI